MDSDELALQSWEDEGGAIEASRFREVPGTNLTTTNELFAPSINQDAERPITQQVGVRESHPSGRVS